MFHDPKPYSDYVETGSPWLRRVPSHWRMPRIKTVVREVSDKGHPNEPLLAATQSHGVIRKDQYENRTVEAMNSLETLKLVTVGDFVISLRSFQGGIERAHARGIISPAYTILRPLGANETDYLTLLFKSLPFIDALRLAVTGIREGQNIEYPRLARDMIPLPPPAEQEAIVTYLAHAHQRINQAIALQRRLITLLVEQSRVVANRAVTRGLFDAPSRDSGNPFLGVVPNHWEAVAVSRLVQFVTSGSRGWAEYYSDDGPLFLQSGNLGRSLRLDLTRTQRVRPPEGSEGTRTRVRRDDILVCITGALTGNVVVVDQELGEAYVNQHVALVRPRGAQVMPQFLALALWCAPGQDQFRSAQYGGTKQGLGLADVKGVRIALPPPSEQREIVELVGSQTTRIHREIGRARREIDLLEEFRTSLTSDVVTGQLDVRAAAATLPKIDPAVVFATSTDGAGEDDEESFEGDEQGEA